MKVTTLRLPEELHEELVEEAEERDISTAKYLRQILKRRDRLASDGEANTQANTPANTLAERVEELATRVEELEERQGGAPASPPSTGNVDSAVVADGRPDSPESSAENPHPSPAEDGVPQPEEADSPDVPLRERMENELEALDVPGRKAAVERTRREAIEYAWDYLRDRGSANSSEIANATFGEFFDDDHLGYSTSSRYPGYQLWDRCVRDALVELPGVVGPGPRGSKYRFDADAE